MHKEEGLSDWHLISPQENKLNRKEGVIVLRELPETELSDDSDYERWYFEEQRAAWEAAGKEAQGERAGRKLNQHHASQEGMKRETTTRCGAKLPF